MQAQVCETLTNVPRRSKAGGRRTPTIAVIAMAAPAAAVEDNRAQQVCRQTLRGWGATTRMRLKVEEGMVAAHHHNAVRKVDALVCRADHACVNESRYTCSMAHSEFVLVVHMLVVTSQVFKFW